MENEASSRSRKLFFPWGRVGVYLAILFWIIAMMSGFVGVYDTQPSAVAAFFCMAIFLSALVCGSIGIFKPGLQNKIFSVLALSLTIVPLIVALIK